jgi:hypothetical protein
MSRELWKVGVQWKDRRPEGTLRHSQIVVGYGPGALVDFVDDAAMIAGLSWWARGEEVVEDRLLSMLRRQEGYEHVKLFAPPQGDARSLDDPTRKWIKAFRFPEWFVCQNERCWEDADQPPRRDGARPRRLLRINQLDGQGHKCKGGKGKASKVQPIRFIRACRRGHIEDIAWFALVHRKHPDCKRPILWLDEAGATGDLQDVRITCSGCGDNLRMSAAAQRFTEGQPTLGLCEGKRPWLGDGRAEGCGEPMRFLLRSATHAYFSVTASVIHVPDAGAEIREGIAKVIELIKNAKSAAMIEMLRDMQDPVKAALEGISSDAAFAEVVRLRDGNAVPHKKVKEAEIELLQTLPIEVTSDRPGGRFFGRAIALPAKRSRVMDRVDRVVLIHRLSEVRALAGFTRFEPLTADVDGELDIGAEVARLDEPLTWLPAVENYGEGFFFSLKSRAVADWETWPAVGARAKLFKQGFKLWQQQRDDRKTAKADFILPRFVLLHSLAHLLITAVSLDCGYAASSIRERIYSGAGGSGILLYTTLSGAEGSLGGLVEVGRRLERYLEQALDLGRLCSNDPVCAAHQPAHEIGAEGRYLEGASCHGCLLISEPSCERMNQYLDRTLVVPTVETADAAFFGAR